MESRSIKIYHYMNFILLFQGLIQCFTSGWSPPFENVCDLNWIKAPKVQIVSNRERRAVLRFCQNLWVLSLRYSIQFINISWTQASQLQINILNVNKITWSAMKDNQFLWRLSMSGIEFHVSTCPFILVQFINHIEIGFQLPYHRRKVPETGQLKDLSLWHKKI